MTEFYKPKFEGKISILQPCYCHALSCLTKEGGIKELDSLNKEFWNILFGIFSFHRLLRGGEEKQYSWKKCSVFDICFFGTCCTGWSKVSRVILPRIMKLEKRIFKQYHSTWPRLQQRANCVFYNMNSNCIQNTFFDDGLVKCRLKVKGVSIVWTCQIQ